MIAENRQCNKCKETFTLEPDDFAFYEKMKVPAPKVCPDCRFKMRAIFRNETTLYSGQKCGLCNKSILSTYNPKLNYTVYCYDCFYSEKWNPLDYFIEYDENKSILSQFKELLQKVPKLNLFISLGTGANINSEYINMAGGCKNCYLVFNTTPAEDLLYSRGVRNGKDSSDIYFGINFEKSYESVNVNNSSAVLYGQNVNSSLNCCFILNCRNLSNCFGCVNLNSKSYYFLNQPMTPDEYKTKVSEIMGSYEKIQNFKKEFESFILKFPMRESNNIKTVDSSGDYLFECKNVKNSLEINSGENCKYSFSSIGIKDSIGTIGYGRQSEKLLEVVATGFSSNVVGTMGADNCLNILYGFYLRNCKNCVASDSIHHVEYGILNKRYEKAEYEKIREKIINELTELGIYGLMIPSELSPYSYNETIAQDNFPLTKEEALAQGFRWEDDIQKTEGKETLKSEEIPDNIKDVTPLITKEILACVECHRNYKITEQELLFYKKMNIPIPRICFYCRHKNRIKQRGPYKFWERNCDKCKKEITTNYAPDRPEIVYCERCYQNEVY